MPERFLWTLFWYVELMLFTQFMCILHTQRHVRWFLECAGWKAGCREACPGALALLSGAGRWAQWLERGRRGAREPHVQGFASDTLSWCPAFLMVHGPHSPAARSSDFSLPASLRPACPPGFRLRPQGSSLETVSFFPDALHCRGASSLLRAPFLSRCFRHARRKPPRWPCYFCVSGLVPLDGSCSHSLGARVLQLVFCRLFSAG